MALACPLLRVSVRGRVGGRGQPSNFAAIHRFACNVFAAYLPPKGMCHDEML